MLEPGRQPRAQTPGEDCDVIIRHDEFELVEYQERIYRGCEPSSERLVLEAINELLPRYDRMATFKDDATAPIAFYVRRD